LFFIGDNSFLGFGIFDSNFVSIGLSFLTLLLLFLRFKLSDEAEVEIADPPNFGLTLYTIFVSTIGSRKCIPMDLLRI
jgi:hypothetical protein